MISDIGISRQLNTGATTVASKAALPIADNSYGSAPWSGPETFSVKNSKVCDVCAFAVCCACWSFAWSFANSLVCFIVTYSFLIISLASLAG